MVKQAIRKVAPESLKPHPLAHLIPDMRPSEWQDFYNDIVIRGIKVPLEVLADGTVVDGKHRLRAAIESGMKEVPIVDAPLSGDSPESYMLKAAVLRRHLTDDQRAIIASLWKEENKKQGERTDLTSARRGAEVKDIGHPTRAEATEFFKVSRRKIDQATYVQSHSLDLAKKVHRGEIALSNAYRQAKAPEERQKIASTTPPQGTYQVIVVDPPWPFSSRREDPTRQGMIPYESMSIEEIKALNIPAAESSILWLWVPNAFIHEAFHVLEAWGFTYHTTLTWAKNFIGLGDWLGGQTEHCLLATKGNYRIFRKNESTLLTSPKTKHSEKPDTFYELVKGLCPGTKIDMFARRKREGWSYWGVEVNE
jgi:N6-adenosine-specific RNA methylase IME4